MGGGEITSQRQKNRCRLVIPDQGSFLLHVTENLKDSIIMQTCSQTYHIPSFAQLFTDHVTLFESFYFYFSL